MCVYKSYIFKHLGNYFESHFISPMAQRQESSPKYHISVIHHLNLPPVGWLFTGICSFLEHLCLVIKLFYQIRQKLNMSNFKQLVLVFSFKTILSLSYLLSIFLKVAVIIRLSTVVCNAGEISTVFLLSQRSVFKYLLSIGYTVCLALF